MDLKQACMFKPPRLVLHACNSAHRWIVLWHTQVVDALHAAGADERVKGVIAHIGSTQNFSGLAQIQELRDAVMQFRSVCLHRLLAFTAQQSWEL